jgi:hypothetical protein
VHAKVDAINSAMGVYYVLEIEGSPGIPPGRWVYTNNPTYLSMEVAYFSLLSMHLWKPEFHYRKIHVQDTTCLGPTLDPSDTAEWDARLQSVYTQLMAMLIDSGTTAGLSTDLSGIQGVLFYVDPAHGPYYNPAIYMFTRSYFEIGAYQMGEYISYSDISFANSVTLSLVIAGIAALLLVCFFSLWGNRMLQLDDAFQRAQTLNRAQDEQLDVRGKMPAPRVKWAKTAPPPEFDSIKDLFMLPFRWMYSVLQRMLLGERQSLTFPFALIETSFVIPLRNEYVDSFKYFMSQRMHTAKLEKVRLISSRYLHVHVRIPTFTHSPQVLGVQMSALDGGEVPTLAESDLFELYSTFCLAQQLREETSELKLHQRLISEFHAITTRGPSRRIHGLLWLTEAGLARAAKTDMQMLIDGMCTRNEVTSSKLWTDVAPTFPFMVYIDAHPLLVLMKQNLIKHAGAIDDAEKNVSTPFVMAAEEAKELLISGLIEVFCVRNKHVCTSLEDVDASSGSDIPGSTPGFSSRYVAFCVAMGVPVQVDIEKWPSLLRAMALRCANHPT